MHSTAVQSDNHPSRNIDARVKREAMRMMKGLEDWSEGKD